MLLHDSSFHLSNHSDHGMITVAYSSLFHSKLTLIISTIGMLLNFISMMRIVQIMCRGKKYKKQKINCFLNEKQKPNHILRHHRYRFLFAMATNDFLLCFSSMVSCLDEKYFFQAWLVQRNLCAAHILIWKFTLHFTPILIIFILCRYFFILNRRFPHRYGDTSTWNQFFCSDLSILIPFVLALAWSVDGLWLWGVAQIKDFLINQNLPDNQTNSTVDFSFITNNQTANSSFISTGIVETGFLPEQTLICNLQKNSNLLFTIRILRLIQADFLLLLSLHFIGLLMEIILHIRLCCSIRWARISSNVERKLCVFILYIFVGLTLTSLPFYFHRGIDIIFDGQAGLINPEIVNSRTLAQFLLFGSCFKPILLFILFFPSDLFLIEKIHDERKSAQSNDEQTQILVSLPTSNHQIALIHHKDSNGLGRMQQRYSAFVTSNRKTSIVRQNRKCRAQSTPAALTVPTIRHNSLCTEKDLKAWLESCHSITVDHTEVELHNGTVGFP